ncbi:MAG: hypothetical protein BWY71_01500 [Planctomycetes bacterium ADurb.Bin412]|nr:MAG: hypothetical protein BWY71_01500 [Planctomycetes bacterium ADurb.Bin412]
MKKLNMLAILFTFLAAAFFPLTIRAADQTVLDESLKDSLVYLELSSYAYKFFHLEPCLLYAHGLHFLCECNRHWKAIHRRSISVWLSLDVIMPIAGLF